MEGFDAKRLLPVTVDQKGKEQTVVNKPQPPPDSCHNRVGPSATLTCKRGAVPHPAANCLVSRTKPGCTYRQLEVSCSRVSAIPVSPASVSRTHCALIPRRRVSIVVSNVTLVPGFCLHVLTVVK